MAKTAEEHVGLIFEAWDTGGSLEDDIEAHLKAYAHQEVRAFAEKAVKAKEKIDNGEWGKNASPTFFFGTQLMAEAIEALLEEVQ